MQPNGPERTRNEPEMDQNQALWGGMAREFVGMGGVGVVRGKENHYPSTKARLPPSRILQRKTKGQQLPREASTPTLRSDLALQDRILNKSARFSG